MSSLPAPVLAAVSGGADSMALLHCLAEWSGSSGARLIACHYNHRLRADQAHARDLEVVRAACAKLGVPMVTEAAPAGGIRRSAAEQRSGIEAAARSWRYDFFRRACALTGARVVCTGHNEDDQVETVLLGLERGVDPIALAGMPARRSLGERIELVRPLLTVSRADIAQHLRARGITWSEDASNADLRFARNRLRRVLLPELESADAGFRAQILALASDARRQRTEAEAEAAELAWSHAGTATETDAALFVRASRAARLLSLFHEAGRRGMVRPSSRLSVRFFAPLLADELREGTLLLSRGCRIERTGTVLRWTGDVVRRGEYGYLRGVTPGVAVDLPAGRRLTVLSGEKEITDNQRGVIELNQVHLPLVVRSRRAGDVIPQGNGRKSVADLMSEMGIPRADRDAVPVLCDRAGVIAVLGGFWDAGRDVVAHRRGDPGERCMLVTTETSAREDGRTEKDPDV